MADEIEIEVYAGPSGTGPVFEKLHARKVGEDTYELLSSPGLTLNLAMGDIVSIKNKEKPAEVLKRGGVASKYIQITYHKNMLRS